jgi:peptidyl-prolyl isomerase E (cyclophilin E)
MSRTTLYVGGLADEVTEAILHAAFLPFGELKDVNLPVDHGTQKNRGFGFVTFVEACVP